MYASGNSKTDTKSVLLNGQSATFVVAFESGFITEPKEEHYAEITGNLFYMKISIQTIM